VLRSVPDGRRAASTIALLEVEPELRRLLSAEECAAAQRFLLPVATVHRDWDVHALLEDSNAFGALVLDGLLVQTVRIGRSQTLQLLGPGALVPMARGAEPVPTARGRLCPIDETRLVVFGRAFLIAAHLWPVLVICLHERMREESARVTRQLAICQLPRVQDRVVEMLRLLAESWGRVTPAGIRLELALTHETLGGLIGARRPTVSLALKELAEQNAVIRQDDDWLIAGHDSRV
jgi:CRP/FNR family cyclic AMP-dependent transcriptional regulator